MQSTKCIAGFNASLSPIMRVNARFLQRSGVAAQGPSLKSFFIGRPPASIRSAPQLAAAEPSGRPDPTSTPSSSSDPNVKYNTEFGYSRKDIILIGVGLIAFGYILYYGLQYGGMDAGMAGNWVQLIIFLGICIGWVGSYLYRVANKQMTYAKQLEEYEEAVMKKRLEEMPEAELESVMEDIQREKAARRGGNSP